MNKSVIFKAQLTNVIKASRTWSLEKLRKKINLAINSVRKNILKIKIDHFRNESKYFSVKCVWVELV